MTGWLSSTAWAAEPAPNFSPESPQLAHQWLEKMSYAKHHLDYDGVFVYLSESGQMMSMRIIHKTGQQGEHERLISLNGAEHQFSHDSQIVTCMLPNKTLTRISTGKQAIAFPGSLPAGDIDELDKYYGFSLTGQGRIAGRPVQKILVKPKDAYRYGYQLWLDNASGLLLKSDLIDEYNELAEQLMFTTIEVQRPPTGKKPATIPCPPDAMEKASQRAATPLGKIWRLKKLPKGFVVAQHGRRLLLNQRKPVEHMILTDGLASVSVYVEPFDSKDQLVGASRMGVVNAFGAVLDGYQVTAVGVVPPATARMIAQSLRRQAP